MARSRANRRRWSAAQQIVRHQAVNDFLGLATWGVIAGLIAGVTVHSASSVARRASIVRWCLIVGVVAAVFFGGAVAVGATVVPTRGVMGVGIVGFPALVAGVVLLALARLKKSTPSRTRESPDV